MQRHFVDDDDNITLVIILIIIVIMQGGATLRSFVKYKLHSWALPLCQVIIRMIIYHDDEEHTFGCKLCEMDFK